MPLLHGCLVFSVAVQFLVILLFDPVYKIQNLVEPSFCSQCSDVWGTCVLVWSYLHTVLGTWWPLSKWVLQFWEILFNFSFYDFLSFVFSVLSSWPSYCLCVVPLKYPSNILWFLSPFFHPFVLLPGRFLSTIPSIFLLKFSFLHNFTFQELFFFCSVPTLVTVLSSLLWLIAFPPPF